MGRTAQTVQTSLNRTALLRDFINDNEAAILAGDHVVPLTYQRQPFRGGSSNGESISAFFEADGIQFLLVGREKVAAAT